MTTKCANPLCIRPFLYFRSGKIYLIEVPASPEGIAPENSRKEIEYFWLCGACVQSMHATLDRDGSVVLEQIAGDLPADARLGAKGAIREVIRVVA
jgi:hypothetical protein